MNGYKNLYFILLLLSFLNPVKANKDVSDVLIEGDSTLMGMRVESFYFCNDAFLIETTGARFEYAKGKLKVYQGLDCKTRRLVLTISFSHAPTFTLVNSNDDHVVFWSKNLNIGIYGDSTCIISPKTNQQMSCLGNFKPDYEGRYKGELLLIDDLGGMEIYPQRYETGYEIKKIELGKKDWIIDYELNAGERVMIAAFPGRPFDWEKSFNSNIVFTRGSSGSKGIFGRLPSDKALLKDAPDFDIISIWWRGLYKESSNHSGPYVVANKPELVRFILSAHKNEMKVIVYTSFYYHYLRLKNIDSYTKQIKQLQGEFNIDGIYIDGLLFDHMGNKLRDNIVNWEVIRKVRQIFGTDGIIIYHGTNNRDDMTTTTPNIDTYCDATLIGEKVPFNKITDPYVQYQVRKYGISNTMGMWKPGAHPDSITEKDIIDAIISMNGRERLLSPLSENPVQGKYELSEQYLYYRKLLKELENKTLINR